MPLYQAFGLFIFSEIPLPELILAEDRDAIPDVRFIRSEVHFPDLASTLIHRRGIMAQSAKGDDGALYLRWEGVAGYRAVEGSTLHVDSYTEDANLLSLFTVSEALGLILLQRELLLLHASAVRVGDAAWCFLGEPGTGKSTTAAAFVARGASLLSDDLTAICFDSDDRPYILPAYPQLKLWENTVNGLNLDPLKLTPVAEGINKFALRPDHDFPTEPVPLAKIFLLHKSSETGLRKLSPIEGPIELVRHFPLGPNLLRGKAHRRHFQQSSSCAAQAQLWHKRRPEGFAELEKWVAEELLTHG